MRTAGLAGLLLLVGLVPAACGLSTTVTGVPTTCPVPGSSPRFVAVIVQGIGSSNPGSAGPFDAAKARYCASPDMQMPPDNPQPALSGLADGWLNYSFDTDTGHYDKTDQSTQGAGNNLIDRLAATDGYVLPFSYAGCPGCTTATGASMSGTRTSPSFVVPAYTSADVRDTDPTTTGPQDLQAEIASIHSVFADVPIIVVGHSNGGLIAEQWWLTYGQHNPEGVIQVFALDSPLNGVAAGAACATGVCGPLGVGPVLGAVYAALWAHQDQYDPITLAVDNKDHLFTAIGDLGDPLYDLTDYPASHLTGVKNIGLVSQLYWTEPACARSGFDLSSSDCTATGQAVLNPCGHNLDDGVGPDFGMPVDLWLHSLVKNCPGTIEDISAWIAQSPAPPSLNVPAPLGTQTSSPPSTTPAVPFTVAANALCRATSAKVPEAANPFDLPSIVATVRATLAVYPTFLTKMSALIAQQPNAAQLRANYLSLIELDWRAAAPLAQQLVTAYDSGDTATASQVLDQISAAPDHRDQVESYLSTVGLADCAAFEAK